MPAANQRDLASAIPVAGVLLGLVACTALAHCTWSRSELVMLSPDGRHGVIEARVGDTEGGTDGYSLHVVAMDTTGHRDTDTSLDAALGSTWVLPYHPSHGAGGAPHTEKELRAEKRLRAKLIQKAVADHGVRDVGGATVPIVARDSAGSADVWVVYTCADTVVTRLGLGDHSMEWRPTEPKSVLIPVAVYRTDVEGCLVVQFSEYLRYRGDACEPWDTHVCSHRRTRFCRVVLGP